MTAARSRKWATRLLVLSAILLMASIALAFYQANARRADICDAVEKTLLVPVVNQTQKNLTTPGSPGYDYYRAHPSELKEAQRQNDALVPGFRSACGA